MAGGRGRVGGEGDNETELVKTCWGPVDGHLTLLSPFYKFKSFHNRKLKLKKIKRV